MLHAAEVWRLSVDSGGDGEKAELRIRGRLGLRGAAELDSVLDGIIARGGRTLLLDLSGVDYISSAGLRCFMLAEKQARAQGGLVVVAAMQPVVKEIFEISRFTLVFETFATVREAIAKVSPAALKAYQA